MEYDLTLRDKSRSMQAIASASILSGALCLSMSAIMVKLAAVDSATTAMLRCAIAVLILAPLAWAEGVKRGRLSTSGAGWAIAAGIALGIDYAAWTAAIYQVGAGISTVLINVQVIVLPLLAFVVDRERIKKRFLMILPLMMLGISLVGGLWESSAASRSALTGTLLGLCAGLGYGVYLFLTRRATGKDSARIIQSLAWATASAAVATTVISLFSGGLNLAGISAQSWMLMVALSVLGQVIAWLLINYGSNRITSTSTASLLLIQPVLALGLAAAILSERPTPVQLVGAGIVVASVAISNVPYNLRGRRHLPDST